MEGGRRRGAESQVKTALGLDVMTPEAGGEYTVKWGSEVTLNPQHATD